MPRKPTPSILEDVMNAPAEEEAPAADTLGEIPAPAPASAKKRSSRAKSTPKKDEEPKMDTIKEPVEQAAEVVVEIEPAEQLEEAPISDEELVEVLEEAVEEAEAEAEVEEAVEAMAELEEAAEEAEADEAAEESPETSPMYKPMQLLVLASLGLVSYSIEIVGKLVARGELTQKEGSKLVGQLSKNAKFPLPAGILRRIAPAQPPVGEETEEISAAAAKEGMEADALVEDQESLEAEGEENGDEGEKKGISTNNIFTINFLSFGSPVMVQPGKKKKAPPTKPEN